MLETIKEGRTIFRRDDARAASLPAGLGGGLPCLHAHDHGAPPPLSPVARRTLAMLLEASR